MSRMWTLMFGHHEDRKSGPLMSALGHKQTSPRQSAMPALSPKADIQRRDKHVRFVPKAGARESGLISTASALRL
jgi:hypothetical protein